MPWLVRFGWVPVELSSARSSARVGCLPAGAASSPTYHALPLPANDRPHALRSFKRCALPATRGPSRPLPANDRPRALGAPPQAMRRRPAMPCLSPQAFVSCASGWEWHSAMAKAAAAAAAELLALGPVSTRVDVCESKGFCGQRIVTGHMLLLFCYSFVAFSGTDLASLISLTFSGPPGALTVLWGRGCHFAARMSAADELRVPHTKAKSK
eukprot:356768-Chlamydomonas_euryale.AAC.3